MPRARIRLPRRRSMVSSIPKTTGPSRTNARRSRRSLTETGKRVVLFIDDVDRLDRKEIQAAFKLVKLSAGFDHTSYVLAFDDEMVAAALGETYGGGGSGMAVIPKTTKDITRYRFFVQS